jgi:hypothetical protein
LWPIDALPVIASKRKRVRSYIKNDSTKCGLLNSLLFHALQYTEEF